MRQITKEVYNSHKVVKMNKNSLQLHITEKDNEVLAINTVNIHRAIFNKMNDYEGPIFIVKREFKGSTTYWIAILTTL